jgi:glycosyltransferase involved in cell wall biosynthesis
VNTAEISVVTLKSEQPLPLHDSIRLTLAASSFPQILSNSKELKEILSIQQCDVFHGNGLWQLPVHFMANAARERVIPYILSPHGMLEPGALHTGWWKKKLFMQLFQYNDLRQASCIHATSEMESKNIRKLGLSNPIAVIPNGINLKEFPLKPGIKKTGKRKILFLSRIHPIKGIELLIEAWRYLNTSFRKGWAVEIVGNGEETYVNALQGLIHKNNLQEEILITGPQFGDNKINTYHSADIFVLPTYSENFGIVIAEALACGIPVITTKSAPWQSLEPTNAGRWIDIDVQSLSQSLQSLMMLSDEERDAMGRNGRRMVENLCSIESVSQKMNELYNWVVEKNKSPEFVHLQ